MNECLDDALLLGFAEHRVDEATADRVERHIDACSACRRLLAMLAPTEVPHGGQPGCWDVGSVIADRFALEALLGEGGMGRVFRARDGVTGESVALKLMQSDTREHAQRFAREAQLSARIEHPNVLRVRQTIAVDATGTLALVMDLLSGESLEQRLRRSEPLKLDEVRRIALDLSRAAGAAHAQGIVHRDIKPANIVLSIQGCEHDFVKVLDFGLAKSKAEAVTEHITITGAALGTPAFMAPETAAGKPNIDGRADIYSLGCVAYYLLTGELVFPEKDSLSMALAHVNTPPPPPSTRTEVAVPAALDRLILQCLAKDPAARPQSCRQLSAALAAMGEPRWTADQARQWWEVNKPAIPMRTATPTRIKPGRTIRKHETTR